jgi:hypothetical protein
MEDISISLNEGFEAKFDPEKSALVNDSGIEKLVKKFEGNPTLKNFFVGNSFFDLFEEEYKAYKDSEAFRLTSDIQLCEFVRSARLFPALRFPTSKSKSADQGLLTFFTAMQRKAGKIFNDHLNKSTTDVCAKAIEIGVIEPKELNSQKFILVPSVNELPDNLFYAFSPAFWEFWINPERASQMMELWVYWIVKDFLAESQFKVFHSVNVIPSVVPDENMNELLKESSTAQDDENQEETRITEIDCLIAEEKEPKVFIECKSGRVTSTNILKLYGSLKLLGAPFGIILGGKDAPDVYTGYKDIQVFSDVIRDRNFPSDLRDCLRTQLEI